LTLYSDISAIYYVFSTALLYPTIIALLALFAWSLAVLGSFISESSSRHRDLGELEDLCLRAAGFANAGETDRAAAVLGEYNMHKQVSTILQEIAGALKKGTFQHKFEKILQDAELRMAKAVEPLRIGIKFGPILGLMGTLIPMGPALINLSKGQLDQMAQNLIVAFATTVIGLVVGGICYGAYVVRLRWYRQDLSDMEYAVELLKEEVRG